MNFLLFDEATKEKYNEDILSLLKIGDEDFFPPLSQRNSTTQMDLKGFDENIGHNSILQYYKQLMKQNILGIVSENKLLGLVSFKENYESEIVTKKPNIYISTLILHPDARGKNLTYKMYDYLFNQTYNNSSIFTRTWSTNIAHIKILSKFNFIEIERIPNDRGNQIDTVYFSLIRGS